MTRKKSFIIFVIIMLGLFILYKYPLMGNLPQEMINKAKELDMASINKIELARNTYIFVDNKFTSPIRQYLKEITKPFIRDRTAIWALNNEYVPSNVQNLVWKDLLVLTGKFKEEEFIYHQSYCYDIPLMFHEYYEINIDNKTYFVDLWMADNTILNDSFGCFSPPPCIPEKFICGDNDNQINTTR